MVCVRAVVRALRARACACVVSLCVHVLALECERCEADVMSKTDEQTSASGVTIAHNGVAEETVVALAPSPNSRC